MRNKRDDQKRVRVANRELLLARHKVVFPDAAPARAQPQPQEDDPDEPCEFATVAAGRTVHCAANPREHEIAGYDRNQPIYRARQRSFGPGQQVYLPLSEIVRLRGLGFLVDPDKIATADEAASLAPHPILTPEPPAAA